MDKLVLTGLTHPGGFELIPGFNTVGRNPTNDFRVPDSTVSSFHCEIIVSENLDVTVRDLNSTNGTFIDGQPIQESALNPGQVLRLGSAEVKLEKQEVAEPIHIAIPEIKVEPPPASVTLPDGALACLNHPEVRAGLKCVKCQKVFCNECVHLLKLSGGKTRVFCPSCSGPCELLPGAELGPLPAAAKKQSLLGRLTQTIQIHLK
jgi:hypothetical protein